LNEHTLEARILAHADLLWRVGCGILRSPQDREDAVQSRVMINECYSLLRKKQREIPVERLPETAEETSPDALILRDALERLPPAQRLPLILHYFEGFSIREVAGILRLPQGTVLSRMQRGREKLKELLSEENDGQ
jgi:RNA polymerase sigma-70 factor (ECF subfamily)